MKRFKEDLFASVNIPKVIKNIQDPAVLGSTNTEVLHALRERSDLVVKSRCNRRKGRINGSVDVSGSQLLNYNMVECVIQCGEYLAHEQYKIDLSVIGNTLKSTVNIISNVENCAINTPTSTEISGTLDMSVWTNNMSYLQTTQRRVLLGKPDKDRLTFIDTVSTVSYVDYPDCQVLDRALKLSKRDLEKVPSSDRSDIGTRLRHSRMGDSKFTRLVIAFLYYFALSTHGNDSVNYSNPKRNADHEVEYSVEGLCAVGKMTDVAFCHCNRGNDKNYIGFLYAICRGFPHITELLERVNKYGKTEIFKACSLFIDDEATDIIIMCDQKPVQINADTQFKASKNEWYSYIANYARSVGMEGMMDNAMSTAALLIYHENIPSVTLPQRRSCGELFIRSTAAKNMEEKIPSTFNDRELLCGAFSLSCACTSVYKELVSHNRLTGCRTVIDPNIFEDLMGSEERRNRWYRMIGECGARDAAYILSKIDFLCIDRNVSGLRKLIESKNTLHYWNAACIDYTKYVRHGFAELMSNCPFETQAKVQDLSIDTKSKVSALLTMAGIVKGNTDKARNMDKVVRYIKKRGDFIDSRVHPGAVTILKGHVAPQSKKLMVNNMDGHIMVDPPPENVSYDNDDTYAADDFSVTSVSTVHVDDTRMMADTQVIIANDAVTDYAMDVGNWADECSFGGSVETTCEIVVVPNVAGEIIDANEEEIANMVCTNIADINTMISAGSGTNRSSIPITTSTRDVGIGDGDINVTDHGNSEIVSEKDEVCSRVGDAVDLLSEDVEKIGTERGSIPHSDCDDTGIMVVTSEVVRKEELPDGSGAYVVKSEKMSVNMNTDGAEFTYKMVDPDDAKELQHISVEGITESSIDVAVSASVPANIPDSMVKRLVSVDDIDEAEDGQVRTKVGNILVEPTKSELRRLIRAMNKRWSDEQKKLPKEPGGGSAAKDPVSDAISIYRKIVEDKSIDKHMISVKKTILRGVPNLPPFMNNEVVNGAIGKVIEVWLQSDVDKRNWWGAMSRRAGPPVEFCKSMLRCRSFKRIVGCNCPHPGIGKRKLDYNDSFIFMYRDLLIHFGVVSTRMYSRAKGKVVIVNISQLDVEGLRSWFIVGARETGKKKQVTVTDFISETSGCRKKYNCVNYENSLRVGFD